MANKISRRFYLCFILILFFFQMGCSQMHAIGPQLTQSSSDSGLVNPGLTPPMYPTPTPPGPTPSPTPIPPPSQPDTFNVLSPMQGGSVMPGLFQVRGQAGTNWVNVAIYDLNNGYSKVGADASPAIGSYTLTVNSSVLILQNGMASVAVTAYTVPAGQPGGSASTVKLTFAVTTAAPTPTPTPGAFMYSRPPSEVNAQSVIFSDAFTDFSGSADGAGTRWQTLLPYGGSQHWLTGNPEAEYYSTAMPGTFNSPFSLSSDGLTISSFPTPNGANNSGQAFTSGIITTAQSFAFTYGFVEARIKVNVVSGIWPAFWMTSSPYCSEYDIAEWGQSTSNKWDTNTIGYNNNCGGANGPNGYTSTFQVYEPGGIFDGTQFHVYGMNWYPGGTDYYLDGVLYRSQSSSPTDSVPSWILINLAIGTPGAWVGTPPAANSSFWPAQMTVDWVQAWKTPFTIYYGPSSAH